MLLKLSLCNNSTVIHLSSLELAAIRNQMSQKFSTISMDAQALGHFTSKFRYKKQLYLLKDNSIIANFMVSCPFLWCCSLSERVLDEVNWSESLWQWLLLWGKDDFCLYLTNKSTSNMYALDWETFCENW